MTFEMKLREIRKIGRAEGYAEGRAEVQREEGMRNIVDMVRELNLDKEVAVQQLIKRYALSPNDATEFVNSNW